LSSTTSGLDIFDYFWKHCAAAAAAAAAACHLVQEDVLHLQLLVLGILIYFK
jgi:hypothetical protein